MSEDGKCLIKFEGFLPQCKSDKIWGLSTSQVAQMVKKKKKKKNLPAMQETCVQSVGCKDPLGKGVATHSSILAWRIPWAEEPGGLWSMGLQRAEHDWATLDTFLLLKWNFRDPDMWRVKIFLLRWRVSYCVWALLQPKNSHTTQRGSWVLETTYSFGYAALANFLSNLGKIFMYVCVCVYIYTYMYNFLFSHFLIM